MQEVNSKTKGDVDANTTPANITNDGNDSYSENNTYNSNHFDTTEAAPKAGDDTVNSESDESHDASEENEVMANQKQYKLHPLKDKWMVYYIVSSKAGESYSQVTNELDYVSSIEEVFATINTFPHPSSLPEGDSLVFARGKVDPQYESFPNGERVCIYCKLKYQWDAVVAPLLAAVLGESVTKEVCDGEPVIGIVRIAHKYSPMFKESVRMEIWMKKSPYGKKIENYFIKLVEKFSTAQVSLRKLEGEHPCNNDLLKFL